MIKQPKEEEEKKPSKCHASVCNLIIVVLGGLTELSVISKARMSARLV